METYEAITTRRSIRRYALDPIPYDVLNRLFRAGMSGPSASAQFPWQFLLLTDRERLEALAKIHGYECVGEAAAVIIVCGDMERNRIGAVWVMDCSIAAQNILLTAHDAGVGAVWLGCWPSPERMSRTHEALGLPWQIVPFAVIALGYPTGLPKPVDRFEPERIHENYW